MTTSSDPGLASTVVDDPAQWFGLHRRFHAHRHAVVHWTSRGFWAVLDQALFALSNLVLNVLLARWLEPEQYGAFVTTYTMLILVSVAHSSLLCEPMLVFGAKAYAAGFSDYFTILRRYNWRIGAAASAVFTVAAGVFMVAGRPPLAAAAAGLALTAPFLLLSWLARRGCYAVARPQLAAFGGAINFSLVVLGAVVLARLALLTVFSAVMLQGAAALLSSMVMTVPLSRVTAVPLGPPERSSIWLNHWDYGRWSGAAGLVNWFNGYLYYLVLPLWGGLAAAGALKALSNLVMPILQSDMALITLLTPAFVRQRAVGKLRRVTSWAALAFGAEALLYWAVLAAFGGELSRRLYGSAYVFEPRVILLVGLVPLGSGLFNVLGTALRAREQPRGVFYATMIGALGAGVGCFVAVRYGLIGAILGLFATSVVEIAVMLWWLRRPKRVYA
jgi:O-antigen/teichoic acid export membrane protein